MATPLHLGFVHKPDVAVTRDGQFVRLRFELRQPQGEQAQLCDVAFPQPCTIEIAGLPDSILQGPHSLLALLQEAQQYLADTQAALAAVPDSDPN